MSTILESFDLQPGQGVRAENRNGVTVVERYALSEQEILKPENVFCFYEKSDLIKMPNKLFPYYVRDKNVMCYMDEHFNEGDITKYCQENKIEVSFDEFLTILKEAEK